MKKIVGMILIMLLLGSIVATTGSMVQATAAEAHNDAYKKFWEILDREAELVVGVKNGNLGLAPELIKNSRFGAENAANISALTWQALEELKDSGVKTYYTAEELREMAQDISKNGLPQETVEVLRAQGWSDNQIQALEEYIAKNADSIKEDFDMKAFLKEFSTAFIEVAFKYNEYEVWALEKWKWKNPRDILNELGDSLINPALADEWLEFYNGYSEDDYSKMELASEKLRDKMYSIIVGETLNRETLMQLVKEGNERQLLSWREDVQTIWWTKNGGVVFRVYNSEDNSTYGIYYWSNATTAYELVSNVLSLVKARNLGNNNPELQKMLNQKVAELKNALTVHPVITGDSTSQLPVPDKPMPSEPPTKPPIHPIDPVPSEPGLPTNPKLPLERTVPLAESNRVSTTYYPTATEVTADDAVIREALDVNSNEGLLKVTGIDVVVDSNQPGRVEYHVKVRMNAENNAVSNVRIKVTDYTSGDSDSGSVSFIDVGDTHTWSSKRFVYSHSSSSTLTVSGKVEITYTPSCGPVPNSGNPRALSTPSSCDDRTITKSYSATISLESQVDWSKVNVRLEAFPENVEEGESVTYRLIVENNQDTAVEGIEYSVMIPTSLTDTQTYSETISLGPSQSEAVFTKTVTYLEANTYTATASIYWNGHSKETSEIVTVFSPGSGGLEIDSVDIMPENPVNGDTVVFDVAIKNHASSSRTATVKLFIDGVEESNKTITLGAGCSETVSLSWMAKAGEHSWRIEVWRDGKLETSRSGSLEVSWTPTSLFEVELIAYPTELEGGGTVTFIVKVWNHDSSALSLSGFVQDEDGVVIKKIEGFEGRVPANAQNYTLTAFSLDVYGVGNHTYKLFLDNSDGEPNGVGEEHWSEVTVEVKSINGTELKQVGFECDDPEFNWNGIEYKAELVCRAFIYNPTQNDVYLNSVSVQEWHADNSAFMESLEPSWVIEYPQIIQGSRTVTIVFKNTARTGLITLEKDLFGAYVLLSLKYVISPRDGKDYIFTNSEVINIRQDNKDVIIDVGTNLVLVGLDIKAGITIIRLVRSREAMKAIKSAWPYMVSFFRWAWPKLDS